MSSFTLYAIGFLIFIGGLAYAAVLVGIPIEWIATGAVILIGIGMISGVSRTRRKDAPESSETD